MYTIRAAARLTQAALLKESTRATISKSKINKGAKKQAKQRAEEFIDDILARKNKITEALDPIIGKTATFIAKHKEKGHGFGSGFVLSKKTLDNKFVSIIDCKAGTEIIGEVIGVYNMPAKSWKIRLEDGYYAIIDSDFFEIKP